MKKCCDCEKILTKDEIGMSRKMLGKDTDNYFCLECMAEYLDTTIEELLDRIEMFKEEGCTLFM